MKHELVDGTLYVERDKGGIIGRCTCGWTTGHRFSSMIASSAMADHREEMAKAERDGGARDRMEQIATVCRDNAAPTCDHAMALDFVRQIAEKN